MKKYRRLALGIVVAAVVAAGGIIGVSHYLNQREAGVRTEGKITEQAVLLPMTQSEAGGVSLETLYYDESTGFLQFLFAIPAGKQEVYEDCLANLRIDPAEPSDWTSYMMSLPFGRQYQVVVAKQPEAPVSIETTYNGKTVTFFQSTLQERDRETSEQNLK